MWKKYGHYWQGLVAERYAGWREPEVQSMLSGTLSLQQIAEQTGKKGFAPEPRSGRQEQFENLISRMIHSGTSATKPRDALLSEHS